MGVAPAGVEARTLSTDYTIVESGPVSSVDPLYEEISAPVSPRPVLATQRRVLVTLPVHNEARFLERSVALVKAALDAAGFGYVLSVAEDGSTDETREILHDLKLSHPDLVIRSATERLGRGRALREVWGSIDADVYAFLDADLASEPRFLIEAIQSVLHGEDVAIGSRYVQGAVVARPPLRSTVSRVYNWLIRGLTGDSIRDHQCGLKAFSRRAAAAVVPLASDDTWFWDTEILVIASIKGFRVVEFPVTWREMKADRTEFSRLWSDIIIHGSGLLRLLEEVERVRNASLCPLEHDENRADAIAAGQAPADGPSGNPSGSQT